MVSRTMKALARRVFLSEPAQRVNEVVERIRQRRALRHWERNGRILPPPHIVKQRTVKEYAAEFSLDILVETGTYLGAMIDATRDTFGRIYSIELDGALYRRARKKYRRFDHISVFNGNSSQVLGDVLAAIREPCLFWLDAHHSGVLTARGELESPIVQEVGQILRHPVVDHVILIDDAHAFVGQGGYPTLAELRNEVGSWHPDWTFEVRDDIIRVHGPREKRGLADSGQARYK